MKFLRSLKPVFILIMVFLIIKAIGLDNMNSVMYSYSHPIRYKSLVQKYSQKYGISEELVYAVIKNESNFYPFAKSKTGSKGLMQISDITYEYAKGKIKIEKDDIYNKETNLEVGIWYLSYLIHLFKNEEYAIIAYNAGPSNVVTWMDKGYLNQNIEYDEWNIPFVETKIYVDKVFKSKEHYSKLVSKK